MSALVAVAAVCGSAAYASQGASLSAQSASGHVRGDLLYTAVTFCSQRPPYCSANVGIYTYPAGKYVSGWSQEGGTGGTCSDSAGNVFIGYGGASNSSEILEFGHGGITPIATLNLPIGAYVFACSVDPKTGNLAVASYGLQGLFVFEGSTIPTLYSDPGLDIDFVGYDNDGDAIVAGTSQSGTGLAEFPAGGAAFRRIKVDRPINNVGTVQWDGSEMSVLDATRDAAIIYRFVLHGTRGKIIGITPLDAMDVGGDVIVGRRVVASVGGGVCAQTCPPDGVSLFPFPAGGQPIADVNGASTSATGFAISLAAHDAASTSRTKKHRDARR